MVDSNTAWSKEFEMALLNKFALICYGVMSGAILYVQLSELIHGSSYLYVVPLLVVVMCYCNVRFSTICSLVVLIVNVIHEVMYYLQTDFTELELRVSIMKVVLLTFVTIFIVMSAKVMIRVNERKL